MPFETPEVKVGDVYPRLGCSTSPDSVASPCTEESFWSLKKRKKDSEAKALRHGARRVIDFGSDIAKKAKYLKKKIQKKVNMKMKWYPADKAREAEKAIQKIDPGHGYKIKIIRDESVPAPPMPKTPPLTPSPERRCLNAVLMEKTNGKKTTIDSTTKEAPKVVTAKDKKKVPVKKQPTCIGCGLQTCLNKLHMDTAVASYLSVKSTEEVCMMTREGRIEWFVELYKTIDPKNINGGLQCATKYAKKNMNYLTAMYLLSEGFEDNVPLKDLVEK